MIPFSQRTWVEVNLCAIRHNLRTLRAKIKPRRGVIGVVKANAYGHGLSEVAGAIADRVDLFAVANAAEAAVLVPFGKDVLLLGPCLPAERREVLRKGWIASVSGASEAANYGGGRVNFKVDTGMGRIGCWEKNALEEFRRILRLGAVEVHSVSTHLPVADEDASYTVSQLERFSKLAEACRVLAPRVKVHALNSAGILSYPGYAHDFVRAGLALYGSAYSPAHQSLLRPSLTWKTRVVLVREVGVGRSISYGRTFRAGRKMRIATLSVGYADGFPRQASGRGAGVLIGGIRCQVLGRVTMDQILVDVSGVQRVCPGDVAVIIGRQGEAEILARDLADRADTIAWDIFTGLGGRVKRFFS